MYNDSKVGKGEEVIPPRLHTQKTVQPSYILDVPQLCYIAVTENHFVVLGNIEQSLCRL